MPALIQLKPEIYMQGKKNKTPFFALPEVKSDPTALVWSGRFQMETNPTDTAKVVTRWLKDNTVFGGATTKV